jgi:hypothetical protein
MKGDGSRRDRLDEWLIRAVVTVRSRLARLLRPGSLVILIAASLFATGALMKQTEFPNESLWEPGTPMTRALVGCGAIAYAGSLLVIIGFRRLTQASDREAQLYRICRDVAVLVEETTHLSRDVVGVHVWEVAGMPGVRRLERRATFVPGERQPTAITWRKGKGVIGRCWESDNRILADLEALAVPEDEFNALRPEERFFFSWEEYRSTEHYKAVLALPLHGGPENARRVVGCLSIDVQADDAAEELSHAWRNHRQRFSDHLSVCEAVLARR